MKGTRFVCTLGHSNSVGIRAAFRPSASLMGSVTQLKIAFRVGSACRGMACLNHKRRRACASQGRSNGVNVCGAAPRQVFRCCIIPRSANGQASIQ